VLAVQQLSQESSLLRDLEAKGEIKIVGAIYDVTTGRVRFLGP
jgi:carbonic anhydrase